MTTPHDDEGPDDDVPARPDLRLIPVLLSAWSVAGWATAARPTVVMAAASLVTAAGVLAIVVRRLPGRAMAVLACAGAVLVLASTAAQSTVRNRPPLPRWTAERAVVEAWGRAIDDPHRVAITSGRPGPAPDRFVVRVRFDRVSARGRTVQVRAPVLVLAGAEWARLAAGHRLALTARLDAAEPGDDVVAVVRAIGPPRQVTPGGPMWRLADRLRAGLRSACTGLPPDAGGLLPSLVVGDTSGLSDRLRDDLRTSGLTHVTAVSGANVAIVAGAVLWAATWLGVRRGLRLAFALGVIACFVIVARPQPSVLRAAVMGGVALLALGLSRRPRGVPALAAAGTALLVADPWLSRSPGFALSCLATAALLLLAPAWTRRWSRRLPAPVAAALAVPAAAQAVCGPVVVLLSPSVSLSAVPANLLTEPAVGPATIAGVLAALVAPVWPGGAHALAWAGALATGWIVRVAHTAAALPLASVPWPSGLIGAALLALSTGALVAWSLRRPAGERAPQHDEHRPRRARIAATLVVALSMAAGVGWLIGRRAPVSWWPPWPGAGRPPPGWAVAQCDVGQGAATAVRSGADRAVLVDTGPEPGAVDACLRHLGVRHLDLVVLTHHHADHVLGLPGALRRRDAALVLISPLAEPRAQAAAVRRVASASGAPLSEGWAGATGAVGADGWSVRWRVLAPTDPPTPPGPNEDGDGTAVNESSLATILDVAGPGGSLRIASLGDLETVGQEHLLHRLTVGAAGSAAGDGVGLRVGPVDVLVVAHHGSARQAPRLCHALAPRVALIGVGVGNDYGHPAPSALAMLRECGPAVYRTDLSGTVALVPTTGGGVVVRTDRRQPRSPRPA